MYSLWLSDLMIFEFMIFGTIYISFEFVGNESCGGKKPILGIHTWQSKSFYITGPTYLYLWSCSFIWSQSYTWTKPEKKIVYLPVYIFAYFPTGVIIGHLPSIKCSGLGHLLSVFFSRRVSFYSWPEQLIPSRMAPLSSSLLSSSGTCLVSVVSRGMYAAQSVPDLIRICSFGPLAFYHGQYAEQCTAHWQAVSQSQEQLKHTWDSDQRG